jgi:hypothetical protein
MKRTLVVLTVLLVLSALPLSVFADEPAWGTSAAAPDALARPVLLGDQVTFDIGPVINPITGFPWAGFPIDISLYRPPTLTGWPLFDDPLPGAGWLVVDESRFRRQSWPLSKTTNIWGLYQAKFMLPRENTWYPCGYPCRWDCDFYDGTTDTWDRHGPYLANFTGVPFVPVQTPAEQLFAPLYWPNAIFGDPITLDAVHPLEAWSFEGDTTNALPWQWEFQVIGYYWKSSDLEVDYPADWPAICPWMLP